MLVSIVFSLFWNGEHSLAQTTHPCDFKYGNNEADSIQCKQNIKLFKDGHDGYSIINDNVRYTAWQEVVRKCPCSWKGLYGSKAKSILNELLHSEMDSAQRERYVDTLIWIPMALHTYFPNDFSYGQALLDQIWYRRRFRCRTEEAREQVFQDYTAAFGMEQEKVPYNRCADYISLSKRQATKKGDNAIFLNAGKVVLPVATSSIKKCLLDLELLIKKADSMHINNDFCEHQLIELTNYAFLKKMIESDWRIENYIDDDDQEFFDMGTFIADPHDYVHYDFEKWWAKLFEPLWEDNTIESDFLFFEKRKELLKNIFVGRLPTVEVPVLYFAEKMPEFPGGMEALHLFLKNELQYPQEAKDDHAEGDVVVQFVVEKDGSLSNFKIQEAVHPALDKEAIRVCKAMPNWKPGETQGKKERVYSKVYVTFRLK